MALCWQSSVWTFPSLSQLKNLPNEVFKINIWFCVFSWRCTGAYSQCLCTGAYSQCSCTGEGRGESALFELLLTNNFESTATHIVFDDSKTPLDPPVDAPSGPIWHELSRLACLEYLLQLGVVGAWWIKHPTFVINRVISSQGVITFHRHIQVAV